MKYTVLFLLISLFLFTACNNTSTSSQNASEAGYTNVSPEQFKKLMADPNVIVLDVRTPEETARGVITGAQQLDYKSKNFGTELDKLKRDNTYLVYCHAGSRSTNACKMMKEKGFKNLYNLDGGYAGWE